MAVLTGQVLTATQFTSFCPSLSTDGHVFGAVTSPFLVEDSKTALTHAAVNRVSNVSVPAQMAIVGVKLNSYLQDYYFRVHVRPSRIDLGNLLSSQTRQVEVWNAHLTSKLLASITRESVEGLVLSEPVATPTTFGADEARVYTLSVSTNGPPVIDTKYTFNFPTDHPTLTVTGRRVVVWPFMPQTKHKEMLEWQTDIIPSFNKEQRLALRAAPRQAFTFEFQLDPYQFSRAKAIATKWAHRVYGIPVWSELTRLGPLSAGATEILVDTTVADYRQDDIIIIWESDTNNVAVEIGAVLADRVQLKLPLEKSYQNAYVAPLRFARTFDGMQFRRSNHDFTIASATFQVTQNKDLGAAVGYPRYRGKDVLIDPTILVGDINERISRATDEFDNGSGPIVVDIKNNWVNSTKAITFDVLTRAERWVARKWIHSRRGRQKGFWLPTWNPDLILLNDVPKSGASLTVRPIGYPLYYGVKDIMVQLKNRSRIFARVLSGAVDPNENEVLALEAAVGTGFTVAEVDFICFMSHVRFNSDRVEIRHDYAGRAVTTIPVVETPE